MKVLVTGGAGYIGSVTAKALESAGHTPVVLDSLVTGPRAFARDRIFYEGDIADRGLLRKILSDHPDLGATIHMAARVVVPESVAEPATYYRENVAKTVDLVDELVSAGKTRFVFSSSAAVYAPKDGFEVTEDDPVEPSSPYARTKWMVEQVLADVTAATDLRTVILRYFNPVGSDPDLESGVYARRPTHVLGQLVMTARRLQDHFTITGTDLPTRDGTGVRDYVHVWDVAQAHVRTVERFDDVATGSNGSVTINIGTGGGITVRELVDTFERVLGRPMAVEEGEARPGDTIGAFANVDRARNLLGWTSSLSLEQGIESALAWAERRGRLLGYD